MKRITIFGSRPSGPRPKRLFGLAAAIAALALPAVVAVPVASANNQSVNGVRAEIKRGTLTVKGGDGANTVALRLGAADPTRVQVDVDDDGSADFSFARGAIAAIKVKTGDAGDSVRIDDANGVFTNSIPTRIAGGDGNDSLNGGLGAGSGAETYRGGDGNDTVVGGKGNDTAYLGGGNDTFRWDPGDGSDVIEGQDGTDKMLFNGAAVAEQVTLSANGGRLSFFRVQANITMDTDNVEVVDFNALGGIDSVTVNDLTGTDVTQTNIDLAGLLGGNAADGAIDNVVVNGTDGDDNIAVNGAASGVDVTGLATAVSIKHPEAADGLAVNTLGGADNVLTNGITGVMQVLVDGVGV